ELPRQRDGGVGGRALPSRRRDPTGRLAVRLPRPPPRAQGDPGMITTELLIVRPVLVAFLFLLVLAGRLTDARSDVVGAANDAARAASLQRHQTGAQSQAAAAATVRSGTENDAAAFGRGADVRVTVTCVVDTRDLAFIGVGTTVTLTEV